MEDIRNIYLNKRVECLSHVLKRGPHSWYCFHNLRARILFDEEENAHTTWQKLIAKYEAKDKQCIHIADTSLHTHRYHPNTSTMEEHKKYMKNLLKVLHNLGGTCTDEQFRLIVIASMPKAWQGYVLNVPGDSSEDAFIYLHHIYLDKVSHADSDDPIKKTG